METRCSRCNRVLKDPVHAQARIGPTCAAKSGLQYAKPERVRKSRAPRPRPERRTQDAVAMPLPFDEVSDE